jgi:hypothetical protein
MVEDKGTPPAEQEQGPDKRPPWWKRLWKLRWGQQLLIVSLALAVIGQVLFSGPTWIVLIGTVVLFLAALLFRTTPQMVKRLWNWTEFGKKSGWEWLQLLIVPLALAVIGLWFTMQQDARQQQSEEQRAQDEALQAYLDQMSMLILEKDLRNSEVDSAVRTSCSSCTRVGWSPRTAALLP